MLLALMPAAWIAPLCAQSLTIQTLAGNGAPSGAIGDGGNAAQARLATPRGLAVDAAGNVFVSDWLNYRVRRIAANGTITTYAGTGSAGAAAAGTATALPLSNLFAGLAVGTSGALYIADTNNAQVRVVNAATGQISTMAVPANGVAWAPLALAITRDGATLFVLDADRCVIWRMLTSGGAPVIYGGQLDDCRHSGDGGSATAATLAGPVGLATDASGNLMVTSYDGVGSTIRRIAASNGVITTIAGSSTASGSNGDGGAATSALLNGPAGIAVDDAGVVVFADTANNVIRRINGSGIISTIAGNGTRGFSGDGGAAPQAALQSPVSAVAVGANGVVYFTDDNNQRIRTLTGCQAQPSPLTASIGGSGGSAPISVAASTGCAWTVTGLPVWLTASPASGSGAATVQLTASANATTAARSATVRIGAGDVVVSQSGCLAPATPTTDNVTAFGGLRVFTITASSSCGWTVTNLPSWLTTTTTSGSGSGAVQITAAVNQTTSERSATVRIGSTDVGVTQSGCFATAFPGSLSLNGLGAGQTLNVSTTSGCPWTVTGVPSWLTVNPTSGAGSGTFSVSAAPNTGGARQAQLRVGLSTINVTQASLDCTPASIQTSGQSPATGGVSHVLFQVPAPCPWTASSSAAWATIRSNTASGTGNGVVILDVATNRGASRSVTVTIGSTPVTITQASGLGDADLPFGFFDSPSDGSANLNGGVPVTGWALDDLGVVRVSIWRNPVSGEPVNPATGQVYIGDAVFVTGARPDVAAAFPTTPNRDRAGWGYNLLSNFLPNGGNGTFTITAIAEDVAGKTRVLGTKSLSFNNNGLNRPFGTLDTPGQGETITGTAYVNFGWALTPQPHLIPRNGSTLMVFIDGQPAGRPTYNNFRADIASLFPSFQNADGAIGFLVFNPTTLSNGIHSIEWQAIDSAGRVDGLGSRFFNVLNWAPPTPPPTLVQPIQSSAGNSSSVIVTRLAGPWGDGPPQPVKRSADGYWRVSVRQTDTLTLVIPGLERGATIRDGRELPLPPGASIDRASGRFFWKTLPPFLGTFEIYLWSGGRPVPIRVTVRQPF